MSCLTYIWLFLYFPSLIETFLPKDHFPAAALTNVRFLSHTLHTAGSVGKVFGVFAVFIDFPDLQIHPNRW